MQRNDAENIKLRKLMNELSNAKFNSFADAITMLRNYGAMLDKAKESEVINHRAELILSAYVRKCTNPAINIKTMTHILGEEDLNPHLLKQLEKDIRERAEKEAIKLPSLETAIKGVVKGKEVREVKDEAPPPTFPKK